MTSCQACHEREAVVHLTQVVDDQVTTVHLCGKCAAERGIATEAESGATPLGSFLAALGPASLTPRGRCQRGGLPGVRCDPRRHSCIGTTGMRHLLGDVRPTPP